MSKVFTIAFEFEKKTYLAHVCIKDKDEDTSFNIHLHNKRLFEILSTDKLILHYTKGVIDCPDIRNRTGMELIDCISRAVAEHFQLPMNLTLIKERESV
jgi:hypothetical protein